MQAPIELPLSAVLPRPTWRSFAPAPEYRFARLNVAKLTIELAKLDRVLGRDGYAPRLDAEVRRPRRH